MKKLFVIALAAIGMVACVQNEIVETPKSDAIAFAGAYIDNATRAAADPSFNEQVGNLTAFNVWGYMDETAGTVFSAEEVTKLNGAWSYNNTQYWAPGHTYYFAALAPMENKHWSVALAGDPEAQMGLGTVTFENVNGGEDLIYAKAKVVTPGMSELLQNGMDPVKLQFNHLLSKVKFTFINGFTTENAFVSVSDIKMTVAKDATINLAAATPVWEGLANEKVLEFGDVAKLAMSEDDECTDERLTIPATDAYTYNIEFTVTVYMGSSADTAIPAMEVKKTSTVTGQAFEMGKAYNLVAEITPENLNMLPIEFEVEVSEWETPYVDADVDTYYDAASNTYHVATAAGLKTIADGINNGEIATNVNIVLSKDIDLSEISALSRAGENNWTPIGLGTNLSAGETFRGTFDGQGHTISNMVCNRADVAGLFGYVYAATIKNVIIENATINSNHYAGGIVAWVLNNRGNIQVPMIIENCHVRNSTITSTPELVDGAWDNGDKVGGIVGFAHFADATGDYPGLNEGAGIFGCSVENTTIKAYRDFAGIAGYALYAPINNCTVNGVNLVWDNTNNYKNYDAAPATIGEIIGRNEGYNTVDGNEYVANGVTVDANGNYHILAAGGLKWVSSQVNTMEFYVNQAANIFDGKTVYIENDIDLGGAEWTPIGDYAFSRTSFNGVFDGQGHTISNFKVTNAVAWTEKVSEASCGFFGNVKGTIKNVTVKNATVKPEGGR
ncbi:MAG: fimbrillin family protein [Tidjanibacter sp.]|nr:fimbrillin family protein [Tidjanibacter sp.]